MSHRRERKIAKKKEKKEQILLMSSTHCTDGKCINSSQWVDKEVWDKIMKNMAEEREKNYKTTDGVWYVHK